MHISGFPQVSSRARSSCRNVSTRQCTHDHVHSCVISKESNQISGKVGQFFFDNEAFVGWHGFI